MAFRFILLLTLACLPATLRPEMAAAQQGGSANAIMVLDASNSMWGQVEGEPKIVIARRIVAELLQDWDPTVSLGLVAYGHRREGDCSDIESVIPLGPVDAEAFSARVNSLMPRGRTPLSAAVRQAAELLRYTDEPATVILLSDGIETCNADPCQLATELEQAGVDFTTHVVGFDVADPADQAQLRCLADNTGGLFLTADTAEELAAAMQTVAEATAAEPVTDAVVTLQALDGPDGPVIAEGVTWQVVAEDGSASFNSENAGTVEATLDAGRYTVQAQWGDAVGTAELEVVAGEPASRQVALVAPLPEANLDAPAEAGAGSPIPVDWTGPDRDGDYITIVPAGAAEGEAGNYAYTRDGSPLDVLAPDAPGAYELRYVMGDGRRVLASRPIAVTEAPATLQAPAEIGAGADIAVTWSGPDNDGDFITIVAAGADEGTYGNYTYTRDGSPLTVRAPDEAGAYELRYLTGQTRTTLASVAITVTEATATLQAPAEIGAGADIAVTWSGPDNDGDFITIVAAGVDEGTYGNYTYTREGSPLTVRAPDEAGAYELRYLTGQTRMTLASVAITVTDAAATLQVPAEIGAGADIQVIWTGPDNDRDFITVVPAGAEDGTYDNYTYTREGSPLEVRAPDEAGDYELRYLTGQTRTTLASVAITVTEAAATLQAPAEIGAGAGIAVTWTGPDNDRDFITIVPAGAEDGEYDAYTYTREGSPLEVRAPDEAGAYELRYLTGQTRTTLASVPITVTAAGATLEAPMEVVAGAGIRVDWTGPDNDRDFITVVPANAEEGTYDNYTYTREGSPLEVRAPDEAGDFELRYLTGQTRATLAAIPITVTKATATLEAPAQIVAGADIRIDWTGPDNDRDFITVVAAGADEGTYDNYTYTREGSPLEVRMPEEAGDYELRYLTGQTHSTLASIAVTVTPATATLQVPEAVAAGERFQVNWEGPANARDVIAVVAAGAEEGSLTSGYRRATEGNPATLTAPTAPGDYEVRYITGQTHATLAAVPLRVE